MRAGSTRKLVSKLVRIKPGIRIGEKDHGFLMIARELDGTVFRHGTSIWMKRRPHAPYVSSNKKMTAPAIMSASFPSWVCIGRTFIGGWQPFNKVLPFTCSNLMCKLPSPETSCQGSGFYTVSRSILTSAMRF